MVLQSCGLEVLRSFRLSPFSFFLLTSLPDRISYSLTEENPLIRTQI